MTINWVNTAVAVASRLQFDQACGRSRLLSEDYSRLVLTEAVQPFIGGDFEAECNHPDLPGDCRIDLLVRSPRAATIEAAIEHKWVRATTEAARTRSWITEIVGDLVRVEALQDQMVQGAERLLVVAGEVDLMRTAVWERSANVPGGGQRRVRIVEGLLQSQPTVGDCQPAKVSIDLRTAGTPFAHLLREGTGDLYAALPASYEIQLVGHHRTRAGGVECVIWRVTRPVGRRVTFNGASQWP